jgi:uncharacterized membrane protein HdeD (DUF308 family)
MEKKSMQSTIRNMPSSSQLETMPMRESHWWTWAIRGLVAIVFGLLAFVSPGTTISSLVFVFGIYAILDGVFAFVEAMKRRKTDSRWWALLLESLVSLLLGAGAVLIPGLAAFAFVYMLGFWAIVTGLFEIVQAIRARDEIEGEGWLIIGGLLSVAFGVTLIVWPISGAITLVWLLGGYAIGFGIVMFIMAFNLRKGRPTTTAL